MLRELEYPKWKAGGLALDEVEWSGQLFRPLSMAVSPNHVNPSNRSPFAGCIIFVAAGLVMIFLIAFSTYVLFRQYAEIELFTEQTSSPRQVALVTSHESELVALSERVEVFRQNVAGKKLAALRLTPGDINIAIAAFEPLQELRATFEVLAIQDEQMEIGIAFPLNGKPRLTRDGEDGWITSDSRYLNARILARPALLQNEVILEILEIFPDSGADVPREFIELMSPYRITERYLEDPVIGPAMAALTKVAIENGELVFLSEPGVAPDDYISDDQVNSGAQRFFLFFGVGASLFLVIAASVIFLGLRNAKKGEPSP